MRSLRSLGPAGNFHVAGVAPGGVATAMVSPPIVKRMEDAGIIVQQPEYVALALVILASDPKWNGQSLALLGGKCFEVEEKFKEIMPQWWGEWNMDQSLRGALVNFAGAGEVVEG